MASARSSRSVPTDWAIPAAGVLRSGAETTTVTVASTPAIVQTIVDKTLHTDSRRAGWRPGFAAPASNRDTPDRATEEPGKRGSGHQHDHEREQLLGAHVDAGHVPGSVDRVSDRGRSPGLRGIWMVIEREQLHDPERGDEHDHPWASETADG